MRFVRVVHYYGRRLNQSPFRPRAEVSFPRARQFSQYNRKGASTSRELNFTEKLKTASGKCTINMVTWSFLPFVVNKNLLNLSNENIRVRVSENKISTRRKTRRRLRQNRLMGKRKCKRFSGAHMYTRINTYQGQVCSLSYFCTRHKCCSSLANCGNASVSHASFI